MAAIVSIEVAKVCVSVRRFQEVTRDFYPSTGIVRYPTVLMHI